MLNKFSSKSCWLSKYSVAFSHHVRQLFDTLCLSIDLQFVFRLISELAFRIRKNKVKHSQLTAMDFPGEQSSKQFELQSLSLLDTLNSGIKTNIVPNQEYFLQGSILDNAVEVLIHRLRGLCHNVDVGPEAFHDHEACFVLMNNTSQPGQPLSLRIRRAMDDHTASWLLRYIGLPEMGDKNRPTMVRNVLDVACGSDVVEFLKELGCRREFDFVTKGYLFRKGRIKITVSKLFRYDPTKSSQQDLNLEAITGSHYVEMSVVTTSGQDIVGEDMKNLAEQLKPLVFLDKVDQRR